MEIARRAVKKGAAVANALHLLRARPGRKPGNAPAGNRARSKGRNGRSSRFRAGEGGDRPVRQDRGPERSGEDARGPRPDRPPYQERRKDESHGGAEKPKSFGKPFRRDRDGDSTSRPSWRDREGGERRAPGSEGSGERPQRPERRPYRKDEGAGEAGKPRSFGKPSFKGPRREASARGEGGERRAPRSDAPGERPQRAERRPYRKDEGAGGAGKPRSFEKRSFNGPRREASARGEGGERRATGSDAPGERPQRPERRPYRKDEGAGGAGKPRSFGKPGFKGPRREASARGEGGKPFKRREGSPQRPRPGGPRKPKPKTGEETP